MDRIDFRSDTVTWPTPKMRQAMARARVGDDVYGEDPTINQLEQQAAERMGKQAALFVASGTMGNLAAILTHAQRGEEVILGEDCHVALWEAGGMASLGGVVPLTLPTDADGRMDPARVDASFREDDPHLPRSRLILVENSYGARHGAPLPPGYFAELHEVAARRGLAMHLDGARLFNAAIALDVDVVELTRHVDSVSFCLSKGLCAPAGSVLCGSREFIARARRIRKSLGGGMRQAGILAAAGWVGLNEMTERLAEDHAHARALAEGFARLPHFVLDPARVRTNIVHFGLDASAPVTPSQLVTRLREEHGVWIGADSPTKLRAVTHYWIDREAVTRLLGAVEQLWSGR